MPIHNIKRPNLSGNNLKTGFKLMSKGVSRGSQIQKPTIKGQIATNHPIATIRGAIRGGKKKMY